MEKRRIIVFGGVFNPPTKAHILVAKEAMKYIKAESLLFVPVGDNYFKKDRIDSKYRVEMLKRCCEDNMFVDLVEVNASIKLTTIETLTFIQDSYKDADIYFLVGADNLNQLDTWFKWEDILSKFNLLVMNRDNLLVKNIVDNNKNLNKYKDRIQEVPFKLDKVISSTIVRDMIRTQDDSIGEYLIDSVIKYIRENKLYL